MRGWWYIPPSRNLVGKRFERLTVISRVGTKWGCATWLCRCDCGSNTTCTTGNLTTGNSKSCGCLQRERATERLTKHGRHGEKLYWVWGEMKQRCKNPKRPGYKNYGGRGISVCREWSDYATFREWAISNGYVHGLTIDRVNNDGNYEPSNCQWATMLMQSRNKRNTKDKGCKNGINNLQPTGNA